MLYIYSGEVPELNEAVKQQLGARHTMTTIPSSLSDMASAKHVTEHFRHVGIRTRLQGARFYRDHHRLHTIINNSDAIYLMGGNTFDFLDYAQHIHLFEMLQEFENDGGLILADSAGSIIMSPNIATALIPTTCPDDQQVELESYKGMGRIPFHISPHFDPQADNAQHELDELQMLACASKTPVRVLKDGEGFIMQGDRIVKDIGEVRLLSADMQPPAGFQMEELLPPWVDMVQ